MKLYNTLTKQIEEVTPLENNTIRMYSCGPTVYDHIHIGNLTAFIYADTLGRTLVNQAFQVKHVMNYTDVDDKTIARSREEFADEEPDVALRNLTQKYEDIFVADMETIGNNTKGVDFVKATHNIDKMKLLISKLWRDGFAYVTEDGVYFSIAKYRESGKIYGQLLEITDSNTSAARIQNDEYDKDYVHDFALWKRRKGDEPAWPFEIDGHDMSGRPGWHIECSAMSHAELGQPFDIHTGGVDLIFPHHENEIAQSTAGEGNPLFSKLFFHNEHLLIDGKKMSKSARNFYTLEDIAKKKLNPLAFRLMVLQSHYRSQSNFTWEVLESFQSSLKSLYMWGDLRFQSHTSADLVKYYKKELETFEHVMANDLQTPQALATLNGMINQVGEAGIDSKAIAEAADKVESYLGLGLTVREDITKEQKELIEQRRVARNNNDWKKSDELRDELHKQDIGLNDTPQGQIWYRF